MKNLMKYFACLLAVAMVCCTMTACGSDDDEPDDTSAQSMLVGTWEFTEYDGNFWDTDRMTLNSDGTGLGVEHYACSDPNYEPDRYTFRWSYNESTKILTIVEDAFYDSVHDTYDDSDTYYYYVFDINATSATIYDFEDGKVDYEWRWVWTRVK
jgi:hypothetical protein